MTNEELLAEMHARELHHFEVEQEHEDLLALLAAISAANEATIWSPVLSKLLAQGPSGAADRLRAEGWEVGHSTGWKDAVIAIEASDSGHIEPPESSNPYAPNGAPVDPQ